MRSFEKIGVVETFGFRKRREVNFCQIKRQRNKGKKTDRRITDGTREEDGKIRRNLQRTSVNYRNAVFTVTDKGKKGAAIPVTGLKRPIGL